MDVIVGGRARRDPPSNLRLLAVAAAVAMLGVAYLVGGGSDDPATDPRTSTNPLTSPAAQLATPTAPPSVLPSPTTAPTRSDSVTASGGVLAFPAFDLEYRLTDEFDIERSERGWIAGFAVGGLGLSDGYLYDWASENSTIEGPRDIVHRRGVVVADVTFATLHSEGSKPRLGTDAANLIERWGRISQYEVGNVEPIDLNGRPAVRADVWAWTGYPVMDVWRDRAGTLFEQPHIEFGRPTRVIVTDVADAIVLIQIWAAEPPPDEVVPDGLSPDVTAWIPSAMELIESFRFVEGD